MLPVSVSREQKEVEEPVTLYILIFYFNYVYLKTILCMQDMVVVVVGLFALPPKDKCVLWSEICLHSRLCHIIAV